MCSFMSTLGKCFVTFAAGKRLFVSMESLMNNKLSASHGFLFTVFALEYFNSISDFSDDFEGLFEI